MGELIKLSNPENRNEREMKYLRSVEEYFLGDKTFDVLADEIEGMINFSIEDRKNILSQTNDPVILVSNHPRIDQSLCIPSVKIQNLKGGNIFGFSQFNYPLVRQLMLKKLLNRPFRTISRNNGWREAMEDCWHMIIAREGDNRLNEIVKKYVSGQSLVIFPEGKSTGKSEILPFRSGFFHLARSLGFKKIVLGVSSPVLTVSEKNYFSVIELIKMPNNNINSEEFIENIREKIMAELKMYKQ